MRRKRLQMKNKAFVKIKQRVKRIFANQTFFLLLMLVIILALLMFIIYYSERFSNSAINTLFDAFWYTLVTITTVGYGDITPATVIGRLAGLTLLLFGVIAFGAISGKAASILFSIQMKKDKGKIKLKNIKGHFIICGWKPDFENILDGIILVNQEIPLDHIVLVNNASDEEMDKVRSAVRFKGITYLSGDFTDESTLLRANVKTASRILILADYSQNFSRLEIDSRTVMAVLTVGNLNPKIYSAAEILDSKFEKHLSLAKCDEIILTRDYERSLIVSASSGQGLSHVLKELISENADEGLVIEEIPEHFIGKTYSAYRKSLDGTNVVIGLLENTGNFYTRRREALLEAQKNPNMQGIVDNLKKIKLLQSNKPVLVPSDDYVIPQNAKAIFVCAKRTPS